MRRECGDVEGDFYQFSANLLNGSRTVDFEEYRGKVVLVYNVATYWGLTKSSYSQINALADTFGGQEFAILGFPCNQFGLQEPGSGEDEIMNGIRYVRPGGGFEPQMTLFEKTEVNGSGESEIFTFLKGGCQYTDSSFAGDLLFYSPLQVGDIHWNFEKFLIDKNGKPYTRYNPTLVTTGTLEDDINTLLAA